MAARTQARKTQAGARRPPTRAAAKKPTRTRKVAPAARKQAILDAALTVFAECGFEAARLDDVAARAGVAKGTLYLYFKDKEALFEELLRGAVSPVLEGVAALAAMPDLPFDKALQSLFSVFEREVLGTKRKLLLRLILAEGPRFPHIAELHYRTVVARVLPLIQKIAERAAARGELARDAVVRFPQLIAAPLVMAIIWDGLFAKIKPLDVAGFLRAHREILTAKPRKRSS
jgi:AcrR family transcriptional regulator